MSTPGSTPDPSAPGDNPYRSRWFVLSAAFLGCIILLAVLILVTNGGSGQADADGDKPQQPAASSPAASPAPANGSCPALSDTSQQVPTAAPPGVTWTLFRTMALPSSTSAGPAVTDGDVARCYAHTPTGALLAAAQISVRSTLAEDWRAVMEEQTYGDAKETMIKAREGASPAPSPEPGELAQFAGFRFVTYDKSTAVIQLVNRTSAPTDYVVATVTVQWQGGDWRYQVSNTRGASQSVPSLAGYTPWGGV